MPDELKREQQAMLDKIALQYQADLSAIGGASGCYKWSDFFANGKCWSGFANSTLSSYTAKDYLKWFGGVAAYGTMAVADVASLGKAGKFTAALKRHAPILPSVTGRNLAESVTKTLGFLDGWKGKLIAGAIAGSLQLSAEEKTDVLAAYDAYKGIGIDLAGDTFRAYVLANNSIPGGMAAKFYLGAISNLGNYMLDQQVPASTVSAYVEEMENLAFSAVPVLSSWNDMASLSAKIAEGTNARWYSKLDDVTQAAREREENTQRGFFAYSLAQLFDTYLDSTGQDKEKTPFPYVGELPDSWRDSPQSVKKLVLITHGWNSSAAAWPDALVSALCNKVGGTVTVETASGNTAVQGISTWCDGGGWRIASYDWKREASLFPKADGYGEELVRLPPAAKANSDKNGRELGEDMKSLGLMPDVVHLVGHSAGSAFVESLSAKLKENNSATVIHATFLDAYCPDLDGCEYGRKATWAEQYVDSRYSLDGANVSSRETNVTLSSAWNFDVTALDPSGTKSPTAHHALPYKMYIASAVKNTPISGEPPLLTKIGANLAAEYVGPAGPATHITAQKLAYPAGYRCTLAAGSETSTNDIATCGDLSTFVGNTISRETGAGNYKPGNVTYSTCTPQTTGAGSLIGGVGIVTCSQAPAAARTKSEVQPDIQGDPPALAVSTFRYTVTVPANSNQIAFAYRFTNAAAAGSIQVFVDDDMVFASTQEIDGVLLRSTGWLAVPLIVPGTHSIQVVLKTSNVVDAGLEFGSVQFANRSVGTLTVPTDGLVGYWSFDNNDATLTEGTANSGQLSGGVSFGPGKFGNAATFGGVDSPGHIRIPNSAALQFSTGATISVWVRVDSTRGMNGNGSVDTTGNAYADAIWAKSHDRSGIAAMVKYDPSEKGYAWLSSYEQWVAHQPRIFTPTKRVGEWTHVLVTLSSTAGSKVYVDGLLHSQGTVPASFTTMNGQDLYLGKYSDRWYPLHGALDELRIYNRVLSEAEIAQLTGTFSQTIDFGMVANLYPGATATLGATASSGLPVSLSSLTPTVCTLTGTTLTTLAAGTCTISATQAGNQRYDAAADTLSLPVGQLGQYILSGTIPRLHKSGTAQLNATGGNSGNPVTYRSATMDVCTVSGTNGSTVTGVKEGACVILANQAGNASYRAANQSTLTLDVVVPAVPSAPRLVRLIAGNDSIRAVFNPPTSDGGYAISGYTLTCSGNDTTRTATGSASPLTVTGLTYGQTYACSLSASNTIGSSASSVPVNQIVKRSVNIAPILSIILD